MYIHQLFELCDKFISEELEGDEGKIKRRFRDMVFYISDRIRLPDRNDIQALDSFFDAYVRLCCRCEKLPTMELFAMLTKIDRNTFTDWKRGTYRNRLYYTMDGETISNINTWRFNHPGQEYREVPSPAYSRTVEKWYSICKGFVIDELSNNNFANANLIFISKAAYGLRETAPLPAEPTEQRQQLSTDEIIMLDCD